MDPSPGRFDPAEDSRLVERCMAGEERAWEALVRRHERLVYAVARRYRLSESDLADAFQDVFAALVKGLPHLRDGRTLCRWLVSTTDRIARAAAFRARREEALQFGAPDDLNDIPAEGPTMEAALETIEDQAMIRLALASLPDACRNLLIALYYEDPQPSYADLARRLGKPIGSLGPTRARCIERVRQILERLAVNDGGIRTGTSRTSPDERSRERRIRRDTRGGAAWPSEYPARANVEE